MISDIILVPFKAGGLVMAPIALCSVLGWYMVFRIYARLSAYDNKISGSRFRRILPKWKRKKPTNSSVNGHTTVNVDGSINSLKLKSTLVKTLWPDAKFPVTEIPARLDELRKNWVPDMERGFQMLAAIISIAPLLGLFGTVSGIINTFKIMSIFGTESPAMFGSGIREALVTTQAGLMIAVPLMICHVLLLNKTEQLEKSLEKTAQEVILNARNVRGSTV